MTHVGRRAVLRGFVALAGVGVLPRLAFTDPGRGAAGGGAALDAGAWRTAAAWTETLFPPAPGEPGAAEVNAVGHVDAALADPDFGPTDRRLVLSGLRRLDALARAAHGRPFADLEPEARLAAVEALGREPEGARSTAVVLGLVFEAAYGDPVYGVNPDGIGWASIGHEPPRPRPKGPWRAGRRERGRR